MTECAVEPDLLLPKLKKPSSRSIISFFKKKSPASGEEQSDLALRKVRSSPSLSVASLRMNAPTPEPPGEDARNSDSTLLDFSSLTFHLDLPPLQIPPLPFFYEDPHPSGRSSSETLAEPYRGSLDGSKDDDLDEVKSSASMQGSPELDASQLTPMDSDHLSFELPEIPTLSPTEITITPPPEPSTSADSFSPAAEHTQAFSVAGIPIEDPTRLVWVPAHLHPQVNPTDFRRWIGEGPLSEQAMGKMPLTNKPKLRRNSSFKERHVSVTADDVNEWANKEQDQQLPSPFEAISPKSDQELHPPSPEPRSSISPTTPTSGSLKRSRHIRNRKVKPDVQKASSPPESLEKVPTMEAPPSPTTKQKRSQEKKKIALKPVVRRSEEKNVSKKKGPIRLGMPKKKISEVEILAEELESLDLVLEDDPALLSGGSIPATDSSSSEEEEEGEQGGRASRSNAKVHDIKVAAPKKKNKKKGWSWLMGLFDGGKQDEDEELSEDATLVERSGSPGWAEDFDYLDPVYPHEDEVEYIENGRARFPPHVEKNLYRLSHSKLSQSRRSLYEQVLISNFMLYIISVHADVTLNRTGPKQFKKPKSKKRRANGGVIIGKGGRAFGIAPPIPQGQFYRSASPLNENAETVEGARQRNLDHWAVIKGDLDVNEDEEDEVPLGVLQKNRRVSSL